jgi:hypothetical protein
VVRFASEELARRNSDRPEQDAWWNQLAQHLAEVAFHDSTRVHTYKQGGSDQAGFVQIIQGHSPDLERLAALGRAQEPQMAEQAPHILGMTAAEHADRPGDFTQTVYFTSEEEARRHEREQPAESDPNFAEFASLMTDLRYFDLRKPRLDSPRLASRAGIASVQDIAALTLARDLRDLRLAQRSAACSPRLPGVAVGAQPRYGSWPPSGEWSGRAARSASRD